MQIFLKILCIAVLIFISNFSKLAYTAQDSIETSLNEQEELLIDEDRKIQLHWKKLNPTDFLIRRQQNAETIAIVPVRGEFLVKVVSSIEPLFSVSNGSGLFQNIEVTKTTDNQYIYHNDSTGLVWLRLVLPSREQFTAYLAESEYYSATSFLYPLNNRIQSRGSKTTTFKLSNNSDRVEKVYIDQRNDYSFEVNQPGVLLFRHQIDYEEIDSQYDVLYQVSWRGEGIENVRNYTARPEVKRLYEAQCLHQLGQRKDTLINIIEPGRYTFSSDQPIQVDFYLLTDKQVLLDKRSREVPQLERSVELLNADNEIVNNFNTYIDQNIYQDALLGLNENAENKQILSLIRAKHSFFKPLHPVRLQEQKMLFAYYSIYSDPELPSNKNDEFYLNENLTDAITKKISTGYFYPVGLASELNYELASETFDNRLRIAVSNIKNQDSKITLIFDTGEELDLSIESSFIELNKKLNVVDIGLTILNQNQVGELATLSSEFASKKPVAPFLNSVTGLVEIPAKAQSFKVKSTDQDIWVSIAYPQRSFYRSFEYGPIKDALSSKREVNKVNDFIESYRIYKQLQEKSKLNEELATVSEFLDSLSFDEKQNLQNWTPYYREIFNAELKLPITNNAQIKLFDLAELKNLNTRLFNKRQNRLRKESLFAHANFAKQIQVREFAFNEYAKISLQEERHRQVLDLAQIIFIRYGDDYVLDFIASMYQRLDHHKKAIFYFSLNPSAIDIDNLLASLFYLRQWGLFEDLVQTSENVEIWNNLRLYQLTALQTYLSTSELEFVDELGYSWVNEDRFLLNYTNSQLIQSVSTLTNKQLAYIDESNTATLTVKGPLNLRLRVAKEFANETYTKRKFKLRINSEKTEYDEFFNSVPAQSWLNTSNTLVGTFGEVDLEILSGVQELTVSTLEGGAYVYVENKRNLLQSLYAKMLYCITEEMPIRDVQLGI